jgi:hypothetical protein
VAGFLFSEPGHASLQKVNENKKPCFAQRSGFWVVGASQTAQHSEAKLTRQLFSVAGFLFIGA